jgi:flagellar hook-basal body complex protein FliE
MRIERADVNQLLQQMRQMQSQVQDQHGLRETAQAEGLSRPGSIGAPANVGATDKSQGFNDLFKQAIGSVNDVQQQAGALATSYEQGDAKVSLAQVMVASQKASVSFQALTQVRNKLVDAYKDIMNMPL